MTGRESHLERGRGKVTFCGEDSLKVRVATADKDGMRNLRIATIVGLVAFLVGGAPAAVAAVLVVSPIAVLLLPQRAGLGRAG